MKYVLDMSTIAALMRGNPEAVTRLEEQPRFEVTIPQTVVAEIRFGLSRLRPSNRRRRLEETWSLFEKELHRVPWTEEVSQQFGTIKASLSRAGRQLDDLDIATAAHALANEAILVTAEKAKWQRIKGLQVENWTLAEDEPPSKDEHSPRDELPSR
jgi:tRNA(fMet)-specific endonuclease VapC